MSLFTQKPRNSNTVTRKGVRTLDIVLNLLGMIALCGIGILWWLNIPYEQKPVVEVESVPEMIIVEDRAREQIAEIELENRFFWSRMLHDRFGRSVILEVDWDARSILDQY